MLLKWKPPQIVNGKDDDSLEATMRFMKETNKREKNEFTGRSVNRLRHQRKKGSASPPGQMMPCRSGITGCIRSPPGLKPGTIRIR